VVCGTNGNAWFEISIAVVTVVGIGDVSGSAWTNLRRFFGITEPVSVGVQVQRYLGHRADTLLPVCTGRGRAAIAWDRCAVHAVAAFVGLPVAILVQPSRVADLDTTIDGTAAGVPATGGLVGAGLAGLRACFAYAHAVVARVLLASPRLTD
jgi:hypothetical protein